MFLYASRLNDNLIRGAFLLLNQKKGINISVCKGNVLILSVETK